MNDVTGNNRHAPNQGFMRNASEQLAQRRQRMEYERKIADRDRLLQELHVHQIELELQHEELRQAHLNLEYTYQQYLDLYNGAPVGYISLDDEGQIIRANQKLADMFGVELYRLTDRALIDFVTPQDQDIFQNRFKAFITHPEGNHIDVRFRYGPNKSNERTFVGRIQGHRLDSKQSTNTFNGWKETLLIVISDVTELKKSEDRIRFQAFHDNLTGLPNRAALYEQLENALSLTKRQSAYGAVLFMDLDRFKHINDSFGHHTGDKLLIELSKRLRSHIRKEDLFARMGGDEFVVLLAEQHHKKTVMAVIAQRFAEHLEEALSEPIFIQDQRFQLSLSVGITIFPFHADNNIQDVMRQADTAMYQAKSDGLGQIRFFHALMQESARQRMILETELRLALNERQFELHYQPQFNAQGKLHGLEALLRWRHPYRGLITPDKFISVAEDTGMITAIGDWVLENTARQITAWRKMPIPNRIRFAVNISAKQLESPTFCERVLHIINEYDLNPHQLVFEITESLLLPNNPTVETTLENLSNYGVTFSIDDFGTGYSALASLRKAHIGQIKIDNGLINELSMCVDDPKPVREESRFALVNAVLLMGKALDIPVVAEGVNTQDQKKVLTQLGCEYFQGYHFAKPATAEALEEYLISTARSSY
ncbi:MAG: EAL domain-containing protein [Candidatus Thiodiazotropha sp.]